MKKEGIHPRLMSVMSVVNDWCCNHGIEYDLACDESDIQGIKLFQKNRTLINNLIECIAPFLEKNKVHLEYEKVRGGTIIAFSLEAISESQFNQIIEGVGEEIEMMSFKDRITDAMSKKPVLIPETQKPKTYDDFVKTATRILENKDDEDKEDDKEKVQSDKEPQTSNYTNASHGVSKGPNLRFEHKIYNVLGLKNSINNKHNFKKQLREALDGIATPTGAQPKDLFAKFARALRVLGDQMGTGPLQDLLKQQGINWKKADDGQSIILYIVNAQTNAPQPIARISAETLENPGDFEEQLTNMLDFAKGDAPGAFKQKQQEIKDQESAVRDIARAVSPQDRESEVAKQMNSDMPAAGEQAVPQAAGVEKAAAKAAATPKI